jgi:hypothetical protein
MLWSLPKRFKTAHFMSSLAATQGIAFSPEEIRSALMTVAYPGFTGVVQLEIALAPEAAQHVMFAVVRRQSKKVDDADGAAASAPQRQVLPDPTRKKPVDKVMSDIKSKLFIRPVLTAVEAHFADGVLMRVTLQE